jgi:DNA-binding CsgD family transcriptional regulator
MALEAGYKNQVIENLRETITDQRRKGQLDSHEIDSLIKTINSNIDNTEFWNIFHNNFDLIHENFFRSLRQRFPELTPTDLKFCALMRLNMSTKDIADFTRLTIRGVETARYRIRRKLGLEAKASIVQFLIDFK